MVPPRKDDDLGRSEGYDQFPDEDASGGSWESDGIGSGSAPPPRISAAREDVFQRLRDVLNGELDEREAVVLPWLQALDLHVLGACRADERSKPLLKLNVSGGPAEERLLVQLSQHFEASEVGMLARCLCVPLVSVRVGKVKKQGNILCPTAKSFHWILTIINVEKEIIFLLDPLSHRIRDQDWKYVVNMALKMYNAEVGRKGKKQPTWVVVKAQQQPDAEQCGFYIMRYMKDIIENCGVDQDSLPAMFTNLKYSRVEIDEVRFEWAECMLDYI